MLNKIKTNIRLSGWWVTLAYILHRLLSKLPKRSGCYLYFIYEQPLKLPVPTKVQRPVNNRLSYHWYQEFDQVQQQLPRPIEVLKERFSQQTQCLLVHQDNEVAGCAWFAQQQYLEDEVRCTFDFSQLSESVWDYDIYVFPKYRLSRLFMRMWKHAEETLYSQGFTRSLSRITAYNIQSIKSHEHLGAKKLSWICFINILGGQLMFSPMAPYLHLSLSKQSQPRVIIGEK